MGADGVALHRLAEVAARHQAVRIEGGGDVVVDDLHHDSRRVVPGSAFIALRGSKADGHRFVGKAVDCGASALVVERPVGQPVPQLVVEETRPLMAVLSAEVHGHPSSRLYVAGVTGTNGKTTVTHMLESVARAGGRATGLIGTVGGRVGDEPVELGFTTPEATELQRLLRGMVDAGVGFVAMEVSSHALALRRADEITFAVAAFTNLSQDHLDFHGDMEAYYAAKRRLFARGRCERAVVFVDDPWGNRLADEIAVPVTRVGFGDGSDVRGDGIRRGPAGIALRIVHAGGALPVEVPLAGPFNATNALLATAVALEAGIDPGAIATGLATMPPVPGRLEPVDAGQDFLVLVDYAHTPGAIQTVVSAMRTATTGRIIAVGGAGGDRDRTKRPLMGAALAEADIAVLTSDNPRSEDPEAIIAEMVAGLPSGVAAETVTDRREAIRLAVSLARPGDAVLVLGKGHETGQERAGIVSPFDDRIVVAEEIAAARSAERS